MTDPVPEPKRQRGPEIPDHGTRRGEPQISSEMPGGNPVSEIGDSSQGEQPHGAEVPSERSPKPASKPGPARKVERQARRGVVNLPAAEHHTAYRVRPQPMEDADYRGVRRSARRLVMQRHVDGTGL